MSPTYGCASHTQSALGCCRRSSLSQFGKLWGKWPCKTNGWTIVPENKFSSHRPPIPTIFDCNNLHAVCTRLLPPFESVTIWRIWGKWPCKTNGWTIVPKNLFSAIIHQRQKIAIAIIADQRQLCHTATDWTTSAPSTKKREVLSNISFSTRSRGRTGTGVNLLVFETSASTDSAIRADAFCRGKGRNYFLIYNTLSKKITIFVPIFVQTLKTTLLILWEI